jgi:DNA invertase Pin-like site-specific DNA recombinase
MTAATKTPPAKATSTKAEKEAPNAPQPQSLKEAASLGVVKLVRKRKNGTLRSLPYLAPDTTPRKDAEAVVARRAKGETISAIAEDLKTSIATVRRMETNLKLAQEIEAGEHVDKWTVGERQVVISVVEGKLP